MTRPLSWKKLILTKFRAPTHAALPDVDMSGLFHLATGFIEFCPANAVNRRPWLSNTKFFLSGGFKSISSFRPPASVKRMFKVKVEHFASVPVATPRGSLNEWAIFKWKLLPRIFCVEVGAGLKGSVKGTLDRRLVRATCAAIGHFSCCFSFFFFKKKKKKCSFSANLPRCVIWPFDLGVFFFFFFLFEKEAARTSRRNLEGEGRTLPVALREDVGCNTWEISYFLSPPVGPFVWFRLWFLGGTEGLVVRERNLVFQRSASLWRRFGNFGPFLSDTPELIDYFRTRPWFGFIFIIFPLFLRAAGT